MLQNSVKVNMTMVVLVLLLSSCTRTVYQVRDVYHHDSIYVTAISVDTVLMRDSIHTIERGDTVTTTVYKYVYKVKERTDTCYIEKVDTVTKVETIEREKVVKKRDWLSTIGALAVGIIIGFAILLLKRK